MKLARTVAILATVTVVGGGNLQPAQGQGVDLSKVLQGFGNVVTGYADFEAKKANLDAAVTQALATGQLTPAQATEFRSELTALGNTAAQMKASGKRMSFIQALSFTRELNTLGSRIQQALGTATHVSTLPDITKARADMAKQIDDALSSNLITATEATTLRAKLQHIVDIETAFRASNPGGELTARQIQVLGGEVEKVKAEIDEQVKLANSAVPQLNARRALLQKKIDDARTAGYLTTQEYADLKAELDANATLQAQYLATGGVLHGGEVLAVAGKLDQLDEHIEVQLRGRIATTTDLDAKIAALNTRLDTLISSGKFSSSQGSDYQRQLDQIIALENAYRLAAGGITTLQVQKLVTDVKNLSARVESAASTVVTTPPVVSTPPVSTTPSRYPDTNGYWGEPYIGELAARNVIGGFPDGTFRPNDLITRAQFAAIATKAFGLPMTGPATTFNDVKASYWASSVIGAASAAGLVTGFPDGTFRPEDKITRAQALVILSKALTNPNIPAGNAALQSYQDQNTIPVWAAPSLAKAASAKIMVNFPNPAMIEPNDMATRGEVAALMYQTLASNGVNLPAVAIGTLGGGSVVVNPPPTTPPVTPPPVKEQLFIGQITPTLPSTTGPVAPGDVITITVTGSSRAVAMFSIPGLIENVPMREVRPGVYEGTYTVKRNDNMTNARVSATLSRSDADPVTFQSALNLTLDARGPVVQTLSPARNALVADRQSSVVVNFSDSSGSGVDPHSIKLFLNGRDVTNQSTVGQGFIVYRPAAPVQEDVVNAEVRLSDLSGNTTVRRWSFRYSNPYNPTEASTR